MVFSVFRCEFDVWSAMCLDVSLMCGLLCVYKLV